MSLILANCSSIGEVRQYKFDKTTTESYVSYEKYSYQQASLKFNEIRRNIFQKNICQCAWIKIDRKYIYTYSVGPIFLPIIPVFFLAEHEQPDPMKHLEISISAYSPEEFHESVIEIPELTIETPKGIFKPNAKNSHGDFQEKKFSYPVLISQTPWFVLQEAEIKLSSGKKLKIPKIKFEVQSETEVMWNLPIAP